MTRSDEVEPQSKHLGSPVQSEFMSCNLQDTKAHYTTLLLKKLITEFEIHHPTFFSSFEDYVNKLTNQQTITMFISQVY